MSEIRTIKVSEVSIANLTKANTAASRAKRTIDRAGDTCWAQTVLVVNSQLKLAEVSPELDEKDIKELVRDAFKKAFMSAVESGEYELPASGINARDGKAMDVIDAKTGEPKWSSWDETRNSISACGEIGALIKVGVGDQLVVGEKEVLAKNAAKAAKPKESPFATIERSCALIEKKLMELSAEEQARCVTLLEQLYTVGATLVATETYGTGTDGK